MGVVRDEILFSSLDSRLCFVAIKHDFAHENRTVVGPTFVILSDKDSKRIADDDYRFFKTYSNISD